MIRLNCFFKADEGKYDDALEAAIALTAETQLNDEGCIAYDVFESATRGEIFMICETWESAEALKAHMEAPHFKQYVPVIESCGMLLSAVCEYDGEEKLNLLMVSDNIPAGAKLY